MRDLGSLFLACALLAALAPGCTEGTTGGGPGSDGGGGMDATSSERDGGPDARAPGEGGSEDASIAEGDGGEADGGVAVDGGGGRVCGEETCRTGLDEDCDGAVDEACPCTPGDVVACFRGDPASRGLGQCADGTMLCEGFEFGTWGACTGDVVAAEEVCDPAGVDEDCDGAPNDGCECVEGDPPIACGIDEGECVAGTQRCVGGVRTACEGAVGPRVEVCDGLDQDCDGRVDEALTRVCGSDEGACRTGVQTCSAGAWGACEGEAIPAAETCDGVDEDCDGSVDELVTRTCGTDVGRCVAGTETCTAGTFAACEGVIEAIVETCNGQDDDCDGDTDEDLVRACGSDVGECAAGIETCAGGAYGACTGAVDASLEQCDGVRDEDCDGAVDEGCGCVTGTVRSCGTDVGRCAPGTQTCNAAGAWGTCTGAIDPRAETCDGTDDDCDGMQDEGCECITGTTRSCGTDVGECVAGTETCDALGRWGPCAGSVGMATEVCNARDDDCDASVDESDVCPRFPPIVSCPAPRDTTVGSAVSLSGTGSDPDGGAVSYAWSVVVRPTGSTAQPSPSSAATTSFTPDAAGSYTLRLCVTDDEGASACCTTTVTAAPTCTPPAAPSPTSCGTSWDRRPIVEFAPLPAGIVYQLFLDGAASPYATVTMVGQNYHRPASALGPGGPPASPQRATISARACRADDLTCCSSAGTTSVSLIEACTTPIAPTSANLVFSEYVIDGDGACPGESCEAGEAIEITNLSHCPVALEGNHFSYCNGTCSSGAYRWMDFGAGDVIPPRGVYVAIRNVGASMCTYDYFGPDDPGLFGLRVSTLEMQGPNLSTGWFANAGGASSQLRIATGAWDGTPTGGTTLELISPYRTTATGGATCDSTGFDAVDACGDISAVSAPEATLAPNQLGRLWHPCDAVVDPVPATCR